MTIELKQVRHISIPDLGTPMSMDELIRVAEHAGSHFFDASARRFFCSRVNPNVWAHKLGWLFITSEQHKGIGMNGQYRIDPRKWTIRILTLTREGDDITIDEPEGHSEGFQKYATLAQAKAGIKRLLQMESWPNFRS